MKSGLNCNQEWLRRHSPFYHAPTVILITGDFARIGCSRSESIALTAELLNIGACMMAWPEVIFKSAKGRELLKDLGVPEGCAHVCTVTLGYRDDDSPPAKRGNTEVVNYIR